MVMNFIRKLMYGRYGSDQLSFFLLVVYIVLILLSGLPHLEVLSWLALAVLLWDLFRMFSRRIHRRRAEKSRFLALAGPAITLAADAPYHPPGKEHRYFKCPNCGQYLRVPRGRGRSPSTAATAAPSFVGAELSFHRPGPARLAAPAPLCLYRRAKSWYHSKESG